MKSIKTVLRAVQIAALALMIGAGSMVSYAFYDSDFEISKNLDIFVTLFKELNLLYVDDTNPGELMKTGIDAMLESLDPYTNYIPEADIEDYRFLTTGQYGGIGAGIRQINGEIVIAEPYEGFPAEQAGIMAGDIIVEVNGKATKDRNSDEMSKILKGQPNTAVKLLIKRPGEKELIEKNLLRQVIKVNDVPYHGMLTKKVGYIRLDRFSETASKEVREAYLDLLNNNELGSLVLDLRGNGGGLLRESVNIVNMFVAKNQVVVRTRGKRKEWDKAHRALDNPLDLDVPLVVLIDGGSASASEIVAGALQDLDRAVLVGQESFGKGLVQQTLPLEYNSQLKVTVAKYYIPSGRCIQRIDYSHRNDNGDVDVFPDSLKTEFKTNNGRPVFDGTGLFPDVEVELDAAAHVTTALVTKNHIFDFATQYRQDHPELDEVENFAISDKDYNAFMDFVKDKDYSYSTQSERLLERLERVTRDEKYYEDVSKEYDALRKQIERNKAEDLTKFQDEIRQVISNEIVSRYHFASGRIRHTLSMDPDVLKAIEVLKDQDGYYAILDGPKKPSSDQ